ncbi:MAG: hypothetical protein IPJ65_04675 [Archangiaceae bacterium]|nr:hypothetical protein [Archangiaceae bacterium]
MTTPSAAPPKVDPALSSALAPCLRGAWHSLAVVSASPGVSPRTVSTALVEVGALVRRTECKLFSAEGLANFDVTGLIVDMTRYVQEGGSAVLSVDSVLTNPSGVPLALAADGVLLVIHLGITKIEDARRTVELIGDKAFIGAVTVEPDDVVAPPRPSAG